MAEDSKDRIPELLPSPAITRLVEEGGGGGGGG